jgi:hypothetical protein
MRAKDRRAAVVAPVAIAMLAAACGGADGRPASWGYISPAILQPSCATPSCHSQATAVSGLDFSTPERGYSSLTRLWVWVVTPSDAGGGESCGIVNGTYVCEQKVRRLVTPYDPAGSRLVNMLRARDAPRMPPDRPLVEADIQLIERWILNGACETGLTCAGDGSVVDLDAARADAGIGATGGDGSAGDGGDGSAADATATTDAAGGDAAGGG